MLKKILKIHGIGLFHEAEGAKKIQLHKRTLIHANNGRGKSTLASILHSCATNDNQPIKERRTIDGSYDPAVELIVDNKPATYENETWTGSGNEILVFDANFVEENVHSGHEVTSAQRANLLDFALGTKAVQARYREIQARNEEQEASRQLRTLNAKLDTLLGDGMAPAAFRALEEIPDVENLIHNAERDVSAQARATEIKRLPVPSRHTVPQLDLQNIYSVLNRTIDHIHRDAAAKVKDHIDHLGDHHVGTWLHRGLELTKDERCPYCRQSVSGLEIIDLYRSYFDETYNGLQAEVEQVYGEVKDALSLTTMDSLQAQRTRNNKLLEAWQEYVPVSLIEGARDGLAQSSLENLNDLLDSLFALKLEALAESPVNDKDFEEMQRLWSQYQRIFSEENAVLDSHLSRIENFKSSLNTETAESLNTDLQHYRMSKLRYSEPTIQLLRDITKAEESLEHAEKEKKAARENLNALMHNTLIEFKDSINQHLKALGAVFEISELKHSYRGQSPRTEYQIKLRGQPVKLSGGVPTFATALSEGDKRTMAFAFFAASTLADPDLSNKIVVVDDPMSSLDTSRRHHTLEVLHEISEKAEQMILFAHDEFFLRDMRSMFRRSDKTSPIAELSIRRVKDGYSDFGELDLDELCQSEYLRNFKQVAGVAEGRLNEPEDLTNGAIALRPLLEGYLHRKFPQALPSDEMLGSVINHIEEADANSPLLSVKPHIEHLRSLNRYASTFHHDSSPDYEKARNVDENELATQATLVLDFIYQ